MIGVYHRLDPEHLLASRRPWNTEKQALSDEAESNGLVTGTAELKFLVRTESLGTRTLEGLTVEGTRQTVKVPAGSMGNKLPIDVVVETWSSPELKVAVFSKRDNSFVGSDTTKLTQIDRSEPDPTLFQVPTNYTIEDAGESFGPLPAQP